MPMPISFLLLPIQAYKTPWRLFTTAKCKISSRRSRFKVREDKMAQSHPQIWPDSPPSSTMMVLSSGDVTACPLKTRKVRQCLFVHSGLLQKLCGATWRGRWKRICSMCGYKRLIRFVYTNKNRGLLVSSPTTTNTSSTLIYVYSFAVHYKKVEILGITFMKTISR